MHIPPRYFPGDFTGKTHHYLVGKKMILSLQRTAKRHFPKQYGPSEEIIVEGRVIWEDASPQTYQVFIEKFPDTYPKILNNPDPDMNFRYRQSFWKSRLILQIRILEGPMKFIWRDAKISDLVKNLV
jgi:hypothetical protein